MKKARSCRVKQWALNDQQRELATQHIKLVPYTVHKYFRPRDAHERDELFSIGCMGLCRAAHDFEPERDVSFSTLAVRCIRSYIQHHYATQIRRKRDVRREMLILDSSVRHPMDTVGNQERLVDFLPDATVDIERQVGDALDWDTLQGYLDGVALTDRERQVLTMRLDGLIFAEIADKLNLSRSRVGQIFQAALYKIRMRLPDEYREQVNN